ncbi:DNA-directed RNA polymerase subunit omega [Pseudoflavonifractor capillosus]|uniref:DNA-directed RNA polymerase subunit omega n=1 Tax=Pseudoflavonifractor capillosus TaxID=106588 RepID=UPI00195AB20B|nr:DNA-directed RNA polymerase subunit omega [Pseudoflavonifractor capillosus]MBM6896423.1 DNA-directed RNA polymerase subunit omega [Pseudoflavonifractor capillosus]
MLLYPPMKDLLENVPSRYMLVNVVAHRAREISSESEKTGIPLTEKAVTLAVREVASGELQIEEPQEEAAEQ